MPDFSRPATPRRLNTARLDTQNEENPARTNEWVKASDEGMAPVLTEYVFRHGAHWRYDGTEKPAYGPCVCCGGATREAGDVTYEPLTEVRKVISLMWPHRHDAFGVRLMLRSIIRHAKTLR